jgi:4-hydroxy-3-methylbut-2-en-1-yl diphosphate synthase IspG/GcpE
MRRVAVINKDVPLIAARAYTSRKNSLAMMPASVDNLARDPGNYEFRDQQRKRTGYLSEGWIPRQFPVVFRLPEKIIRKLLPEKVGTEQPRQASRAVPPLRGMLSNGLSMPPPEIR